MKGVAVSVHLVVPEPLLVTNEELRQLLCDALAEYAAHRGPSPYDYVLDHYTRVLAVYREGSPEFERKVASVARLTTAARELRNQVASGVSFTPDPDPDPNPKGDV